MLQFAAVWRKLDGKWAIPGHLVREGQEPGVPVKVREAFENEALSHAKREPEKTSKILTMLDELFDVKKGVPVYKGYVDDPRHAALRAIPVHSARNSIHTPRNSPPQEHRQRVDRDDGVLVPLLARARRTAEASDRRC